MKKVFNIAFSLILILSIFSCSRLKSYYKNDELVATTSETDNVVNNFGDKLIQLEGDVATLSKYPLPKVGSKIYGFNIDAIYDYKYQNAKLVSMTHEKSGARAILISNDDIDKSAVFGFNTLSYDNKGIPHVFEHACLGGSEKYPNANLFMEAVNKTYNTFMNAFTMQHATVYPFSSLSDTQLFELYKMYLDGVLNPEVLRDDKNLKREAYRYILNDKSSDLELSGVVYSEMSGVESSISNVAYYNSLDTMFEGSFMGVNTGGSTDSIPSIKHEDLIEFHDKYYHPSNLVITLYGDIDYEKYLKYTDEEYLNKYDKRIIDKSDNNYKKQNAFTIKKYDFPFSENDDISRQSVITYNVICEGMGAYESGLFSVVINNLFASDGPVDRRVKEKLPYADFSLSNSLLCPRPYFSVEFSNVDENDAEVIKEIMEESFEEVRVEGIKQDDIDDIIDDLEMDMEVMKDSHGFAKRAISFYELVFKNNGEDILGYLKYIKGFEDVDLAFKNGEIKKLIDRYLSNNENASITLTIPKKGLLEEREISKKEELISKKQNMSDEEIDYLISDTLEYDKWISSQSESSLIDKLRVASVSSLDEYRAKCYAYEEKIEGVHFIRSDIEGINNFYLNLLFDASGVKYEDTLKLKLISEILLELPTTHYDGKKLASEFDRYMSSYSFGPIINYYYDGGYKPYFSFTTRSLDRNIDKIFELIDELMFETKFEDVDKVRNIVSNTYNSLKLYLYNNPNGFASDLVKVQNNSDYLYEYHLNGLDYFKFLKDISAMSDSEIKTLLDECGKLLLDLYNRSGFTCQIISNFDTMKVLKRKVIDLSYDFNDIRIKPNDYSDNLKALPNKLAILTSGTVQYNYISTPLLKDNIDFTGKYQVLTNIIDDKILYKEFRAKRSAYGAYSIIDRLNASIYTYRDPNLKESYSVFSEVPKMLKETKLTDDEFEDYKLNAYATYSYPLTKFESAMSAIDEIFKNVKEKRSDRYVRYMREIKEMKLSDLKELATIIDKIVTDGKYVTIGSRDQIENNKEMFDEIIYDYVG